MDQDDLEVLEEAKDEDDRASWFSPAGVWRRVREIESFQRTNMLLGFSLVICFIIGKFIIMVERQEALFHVASL